MTRSIKFSEEEYYHIYNRGTEKRKIFISPKDYDRFLSLMHLCNSEDPIPSNIWRKNLIDIFEFKNKKTIVDIGAYCLMPNHFHFLIKEKTQNGISTFMQKLTTGYTMYFNKKYSRTGNLLQGVFKAEHIEDDRYLEYLFSYVHLNPIKLTEPKWKETGIKNLKNSELFLSNYKYSSYPEYTGHDRKIKCILNTDSFPKYFEEINDFKKTLKFWLEFTPE